MTMRCSLLVSQYRMKNKYLSTIKPFRPAHLGRLCAAWLVLVASFSYAQAEAIPEPGAEQEQEQEQDAQV